MPFQHKCEMPPHVAGWLADGNGSRDIGCPIAVLCARIDEIKRARNELLVRFRRRAVMHDRAIRAGARNRIEAQIFELTRFLAEGFELVRRDQFVNAASWRFVIEPSEKVAERHAIAYMGFARALEFGLVLLRLEKNDGVRAARHASFASHKGSRNLQGRLSGIGKDSGSRLDELPQGAVEGLNVLNNGQSLNRMAIVRGDMTWRRKQHRLTLRRHKCSHKRDRRVNDVMAADVEKPRDRIGGANEEASGTLFSYDLLHPVQLRFCAFACEAFLLKENRRVRFRRTAPP